jgi:hypothetical protein
MNTVLCPHCNKKIEISEVLRKQIEEQTLGVWEEKKKIEIEHARASAVTESQKKLQEQFERQLKQLHEDAHEKEQRNKELYERLEKLMEESRQLKREKDEARLEMQKKLAEEEDKIRFDAQKKAEEAQSLKLREKDKQLQDTLKELEDAKRKLLQGSQQTQGEAFELAFEEMLKQQYPHDKISPVNKGIKGGDIIQEVWDANGKYAGKIIWELKNTKTWSEQWVDKLKADKRAINADEAIIISEAMPTNIKSAGFHNGVWVTKQDFVTPLTDSLRVKLIQLVIIKNSLKGKDAKMEALYTYLTGTEFKNRIEAIIESFTNMQNEIEKEKRYFANKWNRDEKNIRMVIDNTYGMHGDLKGILSAAIPQIQGLELLEGGKSEQESLLE